MLSFDETRAIAAARYGESFARDGWEDDGACLVMPQHERDDEARGLTLKGGAWIVVDRATGEIDEWPHLVCLDRVRQMRAVRAEQSASPE